MDEGTRPFGGLKLTRELCAGLREAVRPYNETELDPRIIEDFCERLYLAYYGLEADPDLEAIGFTVTHADIMLINNFLSAEDGDWAKDLLHQTRQVLFELHTGKEAVKLASSEETHQLFADMALEGDSPPAVDEKQ